MKSMDIGNVIRGIAIRQKKFSKLLLCSAIGNFILSTVAIWVIPQLTNYSKTHMNIRKPLLLFTGILMLLSFILFVSIMSYVSEKALRFSKLRAYKEHLKRAGTSAVFLMAFMLLWQLICGIIASLEYSLLSERYGYESTKTIIDIVISIATIAVIPFLITQVMGYSFSRSSVRKFFMHGPIGTWKTYVTVLCLELAGVLLGTVLTMVLSLYGERSGNVVFSIILFTASGTVVTYILYYKFSTYKGRL